jgi:hypothetical protein
MEPVPLVVAIVAGVGALLVIRKPLFGSEQYFQECVRFWLTPKLLSLLNGEWLKDQGSRLMLLLWFGLASLVGALFYFILAMLF